MDSGRSCVQRELREHGVSMDTILFLETIVHCDSYTGQKLLHPERKMPGSIVAIPL